MLVGSRLALVAWLAACGSQAPSADPGAHGETPFGADGEVMIAPLLAYGAAGTVVRLLLRHDGVAHEVLALPDGDSLPLGRPFFSSASTAWAGGLARSDDAGVGWQRAASLPPLADGSLVAFLVERSPSGSDVATIAMSAERWETFDLSVLAPLLFRGAIAPDGDTDWKPVPGIDATRFPTLAILRTRSGRTEMLRQLGRRLRIGAPDDAPPDGAVRIDAVDDDGVTPILRLDDGFVASDFVTAGGTGWIVGARRDASPANEDRAALVRFADDGVPHETTLLPAPSRAATADLADPERGFVCGSDETSLPFCLATSDGGTSWIRGALPPDVTTVRQVLRGRRSFGWAVASRSDGGDVLLVTDDGGVTWAPVALPPLGEVLSIEGLARNSSTSDWVADPVPSAPPPLPAPTPVPRHRGAPAVWIAGDSTSVTPGITGLLLRSEDLGATWETIRTAPGVTFTDVDLVSARVGWALARGTVLRTEDGGATFDDRIDGLSFLGNDLAPRSLAAVDERRAVMSVAVAGDDETLVFTTDGGETWQPALVEDAPGTPLARYRACLTSAGYGLAWRGDEQIALSSDGGASWRLGPAFDWRHVGDGFSSRGSGFNDARVACSGTSDLWILVSGRDARHETLWHSPDGGDTWENATSAVGAIPASLPVVGTFITSPSCSGWLAVEQAEPTFPRVARVVILRSADCGRSWELLGAPFTPGDRESIAEWPLAIRFFDDATGVAVTAGAVFATTDGGVTWARTALPDGFRPTALAITPAGG